MLKQVEIAEMFGKTGAFLNGHFLLSSGLHSPHYFQCALVLQHPNSASLLCKDLARSFKGIEIDVVVSPALGGIIVGQEVARELDKRAIFAERENNEMTMRRGFSLAEGERVLVVEDVLTTGKSIKEVIRVVTERGATVAGVGVLVDRSGGKSGLPNVKSLMQVDVVTYTAETCPLCKQKLPLVKPGSRKIPQGGTQ